MNGLDLLLIVGVVLAGWGGWRLFVEAERQAARDAAREELRVAAWAELELLEGLPGWVDVLDEIRSLPEVAA